MDSEAIRAYNEALWEQKREEYRRSEQARAPSWKLTSRPPAPLTSSSRKSLRAGIKCEHPPLFPDDDGSATTKQALSPSDEDGDEPSEEVY